ncbi:Endo-1 [Diplonema papillatum]|nr:Endo-1 [Diplonema papillatum]
MRNHRSALLLALTLFAASPPPPASGELLIQAESYDEQSGGGVVSMSFAQTGSWVKYSNVDFGFAMTHFNAQVSSKTGENFGSIAVHVDSLSSPAVAELSVAGGWSDFRTVSAPLSPIVSGVHDVYVKLGDGYNVDWIMFNTTTLDEAFPFCSYNTRIVDGWIENPNDVRSYLQYLRGPSKPSVFLERDDTSRAQHKALFAALDQEDYATVKQMATAANYGIVCQLRQTRAGKTDTILLFSGVYDAPDQQIHLLWRVGVADPVLIESGHTHKDQSGGGGAAIDTPCFVRSNARMLLRNAIAARKSEVESPCSGDYTVTDGPHYDKGWFHMAHEEYIALYPTDAVIQFHGMASAKSDGRTVYIHLSPGFKDVAKPDSLIRYFDNGLVAAFDSEYADEYMASSARSSSYTILRTADYHPATFNVQGRHANNSPDPCKKSATTAQYSSAIQQFVHLEMSSNPRNNHVGDLTHAINYAGAHWKARNGEILLVEAESFDGKSGSVKNETKNNGVTNLGFIATGDWVRYSNVDFSEGRSTFKAHVSTGTDTSTGTITVRLGSLESPPVAVLSEAIAGGWGNFGVAHVHLSETVSGVHDVFLEFGSGYNLDWFTFDK